MKKYMALSAFACLALTGCAGAPTAAPTVTHTVTETVTATATVTATETVVAIPEAAAAAATPTKTAPTAATIPADVVGVNAQALADDLEALGFENIIFNSDTGKTVLLLRNWTVTSIDNPGVTQPTTKAVVVHVTK
jgi:hypothetical protein